MSQEEYAEVQVVTSACSGLTQAAVFEITAMNFWLTASLNLLFGIINSMQLSLHLPMTNVNLPAPVYAFVTSIINIAKFDLVDWDIHAEFGMPDEEPFSPRLDYL